GTPEPCGDPSIATLVVFDCAGVAAQPSLDSADTAGTDQTVAPALADPAAPSAVAAAADASPGTSPTLPANCRLASQVIFYAPTDGGRLARSLVADASPCASFYINVPAVNDPNDGNDKVLPRKGEAAFLHSLAPTVHALCEIHLTSWSRWRQRHNKTWF